MKNIYSPIFCLILALFFIPWFNSLSAQVTISQFDFWTTPLTTASIGPNATSIDPDATNDALGAYTSAGCHGTKGLDLVVPNIGGIFDQPEMGFTFIFQRDESVANFFDRGDAFLHMTGGVLWVQYRTIDGIMGPFDTGYTVPNDNKFRTYDLLYTMADGVARLNVDGITVWNNDGLDGRALDWTGAGDLVIGTNMDGNCNGIGFLNQVTVYIPNAVLPVEFISFDGEVTAGGVDLTWKVQETANDYFTIEKSTDGFSFDAIDYVPSVGLSGTFEYTYHDHGLSNEPVYYRIRQSDLNGGGSVSEAIVIKSSGNRIGARVYPNPASDYLIVETGVPVSAAAIFLQDLQGRIVLNEETSLGQGGAKINIEQVESGMYLLGVKCQDCDERFEPQRIVIR